MCYVAVYLGEPEEVENSDRGEGKGGRGGGGTQESGGRGVARKTGAVGAQISVLKLAA